MATWLQRESSTSSAWLSLRLLQRASSASIATPESTPAPRGSSISIATILHLENSIAITTSSGGHSPLNDPHFELRSD
jgi:hypothetical protein